MLLDTHMQPAPVGLEEPFALTVGSMLLHVQVVRSPVGLIGSIEDLGIVVTANDRETLRRHAAAAVFEHIEHQATAFIRSLQE